MIALILSACTPFWNRTNLSSGGTWRVDEWGMEVTFTSYKDSRGGTAFGTMIIGDKLENVYFSWGFMGDPVFGVILHNEDDISRKEVWTGWVSDYPNDKNKVILITSESSWLYDDEIHWIMYRVDV